MKTVFIAISSLFIVGAVSAQLYVSPGATLHLADNTQVTLQDMDLVNNGTFSSLANGRITFNGTAGNSISGAASTSLAELEIAKTGAGMLALQRDIGVTGKVVFTSNLIDLNNFNLSLGATGILENENENSRITGTSGGEVQSTATLNAPYTQNPGNLGAVITSAQNLGVTTIHRGHKSQTTTGGGGISIHRYFDITPAINSGLNATLRMNYFDAELNGLDENAFEMWKSNDNVNWTAFGFNYMNTAANIYEQTGINDFFRTTLSPAGALPLHWITLNARKISEGVLLTWQVANELNNSHFEIERSAIGSNFGMIDRTPSTGNRWYQYTDKTPGLQGDLLYRIRQVDLDGRFSFSPIASIKIYDDEFKLLLFPNPARNFIRLNTDAKFIRIIAADGREVKRISNYVKYTDIQISDLANGIYMVELDAEKNLKLIIGD